MYNDKRRKAVDEQISTELGAGNARASHAAELHGGYQTGEYQPSDTVRQAQQQLEDHMTKAPGQYQSTWQSQLDDMMRKILNREEFSYDVNADQLYHQYKDQYASQGRLAMQDTMGQAAQLTGGYGNSYAQTAGQQTYQGHMQQLNDKIPELYSLALSKYQMEGQELADQYAMLGAREDQEYGRYRDSVSDYYAELDRLINQYNSERDYDYGRYADERDFAYGEYADNREYEYREGRDKVEDEWRQKEFDEAKRQYDQQWEQKYGNGSSSGSSVGGRGSRGSGSGAGHDNGTVSTDNVKKVQKALGITEDGKWGPASQAAAKKKWGVTSAVEAWRKYVGGTTEPDNVVADFTGTTYSEACAYLKANGKQVSGLMTSSEWARHKNGNNSAGGEHEASSYAEYLAAYVYGMMK